MSTPLEVIKKGEQEFEDALFQYETVASKDGFSEQYPTIEYERGKVFLKRQTLALLQALHDELKGNRLTVDDFENSVYGRYPEFCAGMNQQNQFIQDQQDNLQALIKKIQA
jgi:hypothetical protein